MNAVVVTGAALLGHSVWKVGCNRRQYGVDGMGGVLGLSFLAALWRYLKDLADKTTAPFRDVLDNLLNMAEGAFRVIQNALAGMGLGAITGPVLNFLSRLIGTLRKWLSSRVGGVLLVVVGGYVVLRLVLR